MIYNILVVLIPIYILICGIVMKSEIQGNLRNIFGYKGKVIQKTEEMQMEAGRMCAKSWIIAGILLIPFSEILIILLPSHKAILFAVLLMIQFSFMVFSVVKTELYFIRKQRKES